MISLSLFKKKKKQKTWTTEQTNQQPPVSETKTPGEVQLSVKTTRTEILIEMWQILSTKAQ